jgi:hypothetical protein
MNKQAILIFVFLMIASSFAQRHALLFREFNQSGPQSRINAEALCMNLNPPAFLSGRNGGPYTCRVWNARDCNSGPGASMAISATGSNFWSSGALSVMC